MRRALLLLGVAAIAAAVFAATAMSAASGPATVKTRSTSLGKIIVGSNGKTLYLFEKDKHGKSACSGACAKAWPPLLTKGKPKAASGAQSSKLGTVKRSDGTTQVTYAGHPVYGFIMDKKAGDTKGEGLKAFGAEWYALSPSGKKVEEHGKSSASSAPSPY
jgi:predicted lipoprotein with Yx(FWY)xxD motif